MHNTEPKRMLPPFDRLRTDLDIASDAYRKSVANALQVTPYLRQLLDEGANPSLACPDFYNVAPTLKGLMSWIPTAHRSQSLQRDTTTITCWTTQALYRIVHNNPTEMEPLKILHVTMQNRINPSRVVYEKAPNITDLLWMCTDIEHYARIPKHPDDLLQSVGMFVSLLQVQNPLYPGDNPDAWRAHQCAAFDAHVEMLAKIAIYKTPIRHWKDMVQELGVDPHKEGVTALASILGIPHVEHGVLSEELDSECPEGNMV